ncbi:GH3 auxin-responsive promoter family protein [Cryomorpha ignava]|uniref:GH3 auxin-responsive promoter family protein n=1 Tax=Cryomorpha ignava TaxID=101383 RepID=A0A7K3WL63_9FLAO|nr:GH3 auxin-responsive promoter family protein [Cryomorpha ignava]NEN22383.1 GH3 auxin-responsive promoter family protein [Cryomorpha ignava]
MAIIGKLIKAGIGINQKLNFDFTNDDNPQLNQLKNLLSKAKDTAFGKYYGFAKILDSDDIIMAFKGEVPIHGYEAMHDQWWCKQQIHPDITWPGIPEFFALSSGTTGKSSKRIPITDDFLQSMRDVGRSLIKELPNFDFPEEVFESEILMLSSSANLKENTEGYLEGEISGINVSNFPGYYDLFYRPGKEIAAIKDWDERVAAIVKEAPNWNIGAIAGIPSWVLLLLQEIVKRHKLKSIHDIWPNFAVFASGGVAYETYRTDFDALCAKPIAIIDTYLASEGFFAYSSRPDSMAMNLAVNHGYFYEFIPFDSRGVDETGAILENPVTLTIDEVEENQDYVLIVSSCAGAWRYSIGDTIKFVNLKTNEIMITGRTKFFLNVVGSQLSEEKMDAAIIEASQKMDVSVNEFSVAAVKNENGEYFHQWIVVTDDEFDCTKFKDLLDKSLTEANKNYKVARSKALKGVKVESISKETYHGFLAKSKKKGGQVKTPKVMTTEKMNEFLEFIKK